MPVFESVIRETLGLVASGTLLRRNLGPDIELGGSQILRGEFLVFSSAGVHHHADIYVEPLSFGPARYNEGRAENKEVPHRYVGWGGRHPCTGIKVAKLEIKVVQALILAGYDLQVVDAARKFLSALPGQDRDDIQQDEGVLDFTDLTSRLVNGGDAADPETYLLDDTPAAPLPSQSIPNIRIPPSAGTLTYRAPETIPKVSIPLKELFLHPTVDGTMVTPLNGMGYFWHGGIGNLEKEMEAYELLLAAEEEEVEGEEQQLDNGDTEDYPMGFELASSP
ncbi:hypothetical protein DXG01_016227 [Tephrocybe rancida]|nr:hypothetical protein DXG01_016227 [Tephrocybe rancida]